MSGKENGNAAVHSSPGGGGGGTGGGGVTGALPPTSEAHQYVGPYRLEKTLGKGQTGKEIALSILKPQKFAATSVW